MTQIVDILGCFVYSVRLVFLEYCVLNRKENELKFPCKARLFGGHNKSVVALASFVYDCAFSAVRITEHKEAVAEKIHLQDSLVCRHRLDVKDLRSYFELALLLVFVIVVIADYESASLKALFDSRFVLSYLPLESLCCSVERCYECFALILASISNTAVVYGDFDYLNTPTNLAGYESLGILAEEFVEFRQLLFYNAAQALTYCHLFSVNDYFHTSIAPLGASFLKCGR